MIQMLRLINPPGHARRKPFPRYAGGGRTRSNAGRAQEPVRYSSLRMPAPRRAGRTVSEYSRLTPRQSAYRVTKKLGSSRRTVSYSVPRSNPPKSRSKSMVKKRRMPPRYKSGPKKGQFMPKAARRRKVARKRTKTNPPKVTHVSATGRKRKLVLSRLSKKGKALYAKKYKGKTVPTSAVPGVIDELNRYRKRSKPVAKKAKKAKKSKKARKHTKRSHASYVKAGKKAARTRKARKAARKATAKRSHRKARKHVATKRHVSRRRRRMPKARVVFLQAKPRSRKRRAFKLHARRKLTKRGKIAYAVKRASRNPGSAIGSMLKDGAMLFGGILGMRVLGNALKTYVIDKYMSSMTTSLGSAAKVLPGALSFVLAAFSGKFIKNPKIVATVQTGAAIALFDGIFQAFVKPALASNATAAALLAGVDDYGYRGYGEYVPAQRQLGYDVQEAMALDEYIPGSQGGMGFDVSEALAESEVQGFQAGYAGGSLSKTVFHS